MAGTALEYFFKTIDRVPASKKSAVFKKDCYVCGSEDCAKLTWHNEHGCMTCRDNNEKALQKLKAAGQRKVCTSYYCKLRYSPYDFKGLHCPSCMNTLESVEEELQRHARMHT